MEYTRKHFPVLSQYIYANTASAGLLSEQLMTWRQEHDLDYLIGGSTMKNEAMMELIPQTRKTVARFFGSKVENTALVQNFTLGLNILLEGLKERTNILLVENDYPSVNWPFEYRGHTILYAALDGNLENNIRERLGTGTISILALSLVQWASGVKIDMDFLKAIKEEFPELILIADGTQFCGTTDFNFEDSPLDVLGASAYKWLLSGYGNGFMLFKDGMDKVFDLHTIGFNASDHDLGGRDTVSFTRHFEPGHLDTLNFGSLKFSLEYLEGLGMSKIEEHLDKLSKKAKREFSDLGLLDDTALQRKESGTIFNIKGDRALFETLTERGIVCSQRGNGIRFSFHFYNTETDIDELVKILGSMT
ncbi:aminotransferase class V-fold PLP-dependent enzyme [Pseudozobellia thermophila]|uniref:Selenocysteine lyase/Cysteine desulfurase n=1 Tax=Pseudozobellia thermophila TaxID=192903 RepID=A0A1M6MC65_9FLAO|nr:aminotransferase class V-fold PLP-dependent enzyme [Pseudozobellia thermophila]SHJ81092.1 Selenocysteine lyase/Cysteine desulfurase [Pseudozobellia thermophila]